MMQRVAGRTLGALVALALATGAARADERIRILCPTWSGFAPVFVAEDLGYFKAQGITVDMRFEDERPNVMAAMARGEIEMDMRTLGEYQGRPRDQDTPGVIIGTIDHSLGADGMVVSGAIKTVADLKGKTIASEPNIPGRLLLQLALKKVGLGLDDLKVKEIVTADTVPVFSDASIDGAVTFEPFLSQALKTDAARSPHVLLSSRDYPDMITDAIIVRADDLKQNPAKYRKYLIGIYKATAYYTSHPDDFIRLAAAHYNLSAADFKASVDGNLTYATLADNQANFGAPGAPGPVYVTFDTVMALNLENGAATHKLSAAASMDSAVLASIGPDDLK